VLQDWVCFGDDVFCFSFPFLKPVYQTPERNLKFILEFQFKDLDSVADCEMYYKKGLALLDQSTQVTATLMIFNSKECLEVTCWVLWNEAFDVLVVVVRDQDQQSIQDLLSEIMPVVSTNVSAEQISTIASDKLNHRPFDRVLVLGQVR
jgi:hypothetical protein